MNRLSFSLNNKIENHVLRFSSCDGRYEFVYRCVYNARASNRDDTEGRQKTIQDAKRSKEEGKGWEEEIQLIK